MFKRILAGIIACMMIVCALPLGVSAAEDGTTTLRFTAAGGEGSMDDIVVTRETAGSTKFPENGFTREGYEFKGWGTSTTYPAWQPGTYVSRMSSSYLKYSGNIVTIMPVWAGEKISVTFDDCNGNSETRSLVVGKTYDYVYDASKTDNARRDYGFGYPTRDGYKFLGWFNEAGEEIGYSYKFTADDDGITLSAHWSRAKTITLDFNGGTTGYGKYKKTSDTYELLENGTITDYRGTYEEFRAYRARQTALQQTVKAVEREKKPKPKRAPNTARQRERTERDIEKLEAQLAALDAESEANATDYQKLMELDAQKQALNTQLEALYAAWEALCD